MQTQSQYNKEILNCLLEDWMPLFQYGRGYATIDILRAVIQVVQGYTRHIIVAVIANCESLELRRDYQNEDSPKSTHL